MADVRDASPAACTSVERRRRRPEHVARARKSELVDAFADAAGVPTVVDAVEQLDPACAPRQATGWPVTAWLSQAQARPAQAAAPRPRRRGQGADRGPPAPRCPRPTQVQRARVDAAVRGVADDVAPRADAAVGRRRTPGLGLPARRPRRRARQGGRRRPTSACRARRCGGGWSASLQWLLILAALVGGLWLAGLAVLGYLQVPAPAAPGVAGLPVPTLLLLGGVAVGILLALVCRVLVGLSARAKARSADRRLRAAIAEVTEDLVVAPIDAEVEDYRRARDGLATALR